MAIASTNPATGETLETFSALSPGEIDERLRKAAEAFEVHRLTSLDKRATCLRRASDLLLADKERFAETMMDAYAALFRKAVTPPSPQELEAQRAYHTLYLFQVLTLDRGTTSGLLVHDQNDLGTMGSLPSVVDRSLLASWEAKVPKPQDELVRALVAAMPDDRVTDEVRVKLAAIVRAHYRKHPEAIHLQAASPR